MYFRYKEPLSQESDIFLLSFNAPSQIVQGNMGVWKWRDTRDKPMTQWLNLSVQTKQAVFGKSLATLGQPKVLQSLEICPS